jgi:hypothetical protein
MEPIRTGERHWCSLTPPELYEEILNDQQYGAYFMRLGATFTVTQATLTITDPQANTPWTPLPVLMEATMNPDGTYWGKVWLLTKRSTEPDMTTFALTLHHTVNPPDVSEEIVFDQGLTGQWTNFMRFIYRTSDTWARGLGTS